MCVTMSYGVGLLYNYVVSAWMITFTFINVSCTIANEMGFIQNFPYQSRTNVPNSSSNDIFSKQNIYAKASCVERNCPSFYVIITLV